MKNKSILFALAVCVGMQFGVSFGMDEFAISEDEREVALSDLQPSQSWSNWLSSGAGRAWSAAKSASNRASQAVKNAPSSWWDRQKRQSEYLPSTSIGALLGGGLMMLGTEREQQLAGLTFAVAGVLLDQIMLSYRRQDINREQAVKQAKEIIAIQLTNTLAYPTRLSKINALLKKNEFAGVDMKDEDGIVAQACAELSKEIAAVKLSPEQMQAEKPVDAEMTKIRIKLANFSSLDEQINKAKEGVTQVLRALQLPGYKARIATVMRLEKQQLVEQTAPGTFEKTSLSKLYPSIPKNELDEIKKRKNMTSEEWKKYRNQLKDNTE